MKEIVTILVALSLLLIAGLTAMAENDAAPVTRPASCLFSCPVSGSAPGSASGLASCPAGCTKAHFIDADGDGVCDSFADANGDGVCDGCELRQGSQGLRGTNFTDADGVCDLRSQRQGGRGQRQDARAQQGAAHECSPSGGETVSSVWTLVGIGLIPSPRFIRMT